MTGSSVTARTGHKRGNSREEFVGPSKESSKVREIPLKLSEYVMLFVLLCSNEYVRETYLV